MTFSIRTRYNGTLYRSKLEADWARTFDKLGVEAIYEHEGHYFGDVFYLPDFYLPKTGQFVEVKPKLGKVEWHKVHALVAHTPQGVYEQGRRLSSADVPFLPYINPRYQEVFAPYAVCLPKGEFVVVTREAGYAQHSGLYRCADCEAWWFLDTTHTRRCQSCGSEDGDEHISDSACNLRRRLPEVWR